LRRDSGHDASNLPGRTRSLNADGTLEGRIYFHLGDDSVFRAERFNRVAR
jgi:hypothetical protein